MTTLISPFQPTTRRNTSIDDASSTKSSNSALSIPKAVPRRHMLSRTAHLASSLSFPYVIGRIHDREFNGSVLADEMFGPLVSGRYHYLPERSNPALKFVLATAIYEGIPKAAALLNASKSFESENACITSLSSNFPPDSFFDDIAAIILNRPRSYQRDLEQFCSLALKPVTTPRLIYPETLIPEEAVSLDRVYGEDLTPFFSSAPGAANRSTSDAIPALFPLSSPKKLDVFLTFDDASGRVSIDWNQPLVGGNPGQDIPPASRMLFPENPPDDPLVALFDDPTEEQFGRRENAPLTPLESLLRKLDVEYKSHSNKKTLKKSISATPTRKILTRSYKPDIIVIDDSDMEDANVGKVGEITSKPGLPGNSNVKAESAVQEKIAQKLEIKEPKSSGDLKVHDKGTQPTSAHNSGTVKFARKRPNKRNIASSQPELAPAASQTPPTHHVPERPFSRSRVALSSRGEKRKSPMVEDGSDSTFKSNHPKPPAVKGRVVTKSDTQRQKKEEMMETIEHVEEGVPNRPARDSVREKRVSFKAKKEVQKDNSNERKSNPKQGSKKKRTGHSVHDSLSADDGIEIISTGYSSRRRRSNVSKVLVESSDSDDNYRRDQDDDFILDNNDVDRSVQVSPPEPPPFSEPSVSSLVPTSQLIQQSSLRNDLPQSRSNLWTMDTQLPESDTVGTSSGGLVAQHDSTQQTPRKPSSLFARGRGPGPRMSNNGVSMLGSSSGRRARLSDRAQATDLQSIRRNYVASCSDSDLNDLEGFVDKIVEYANDNGEPSRNGLIFKTTNPDSILHSEAEIDMMVAAAGTGSPDLSDDDDEASKNGVQPKPNPIVRGTLRQVIEHNFCLKDVERFNLGEMKASFYRDVPDYAPSGPRIGSMGTQFVVQQQLSDNGPWGFEHETFNISDNLDSVILAQGGPDLSFDPLNPPAEEPFGITRGSKRTLPARTKTRQVKPPRTRKPAKQVGTRSRASKSTRASSRVMRTTNQRSPGRHAGLNGASGSVVEEELHEELVDGESGDEYEIHEENGLDGAGQDTADLDDHDPVYIDNGGGMDEDGELVAMGQGNAFTRAGDMDDDGYLFDAPVPSSSQKILHRDFGQEAMELQHRICGGQPLKNMSEVVRSQLYQWANHDFSWFDRGSNFMEIALVERPIQCRLCERKIKAGMVKGICEETIILKLWKDMSWRKVRRLKHYIDG